MVSEYEKEKARNIQRNEAILRELGLYQPLFEPEQKPKTVKPAVKKRKASAEPLEVDESKPIAKVPRVESESHAPGGIRRSSRTLGKKVDYTSEQQKSAPRPVTHDDDEKLRPDSNIRKYDPKTFGSIPGVEIGSWWTTRIACSGDSIHAPTVAGISGGRDGAYSVALSGGYEDDVDLGYALYVLIYLQNITKF
ncbi:hypothetical protein C0991_000158 [Blastosporella zonata]|nr:hypothetical protein C0991_000158 [Blastosporella zonata]